MLTKEFCKKWHGVEILVKKEKYLHTHNCVILASPELGISVKPYPRNDEEEELLISDIQRATGCTREEALEEYQNPEFCFAYGNPYITEEVVKKGIESMKTGLVDPTICVVTSGVTCPYAY